MTKESVVVGFMTVLVIVTSLVVTVVFGRYEVLSPKPDYDEEQPASVDNYFNKMQQEAEVSKPLPIDSIYKHYEGTKLHAIDNKDYNSSYPYTPFVTRYDPDTKVNVGPGHVPGKTKWCPICGAEVSNSEQDPHFHWKEDSKQMNTRYSYLEDREVGPNHVFKKTKFSREARREVVVEDYDAGITQWCNLCEAETGPGHDCDFTRYCPTCQKDVATFGHEQKTDLHYGHACGLTSYSKVWMIDMFNKDMKTYEKVPSSKHDYTELDKAYAPDRQPRISEPPPDPMRKQQDPERVLPEVSWVEDRQVLLDRDALSKVAWKWKNPEAEKLTFDLAERIVSEVAQEVIEEITNARNPEYKWAKEKEKEEQK
jgi:hypothetical protein